MQQVADRWYTSGCTPGAPDRHCSSATASPGHGCGSSASFDVSLGQRQGKTSRTLKGPEGAEEKQHLVFYTSGGGAGERVQHCTDPESPPVPTFPQDHQKSSSFQVKKKKRLRTLWENSRVCFSDNARAMRLSRPRFSLSVRRTPTSFWCGRVRFQARRRRSNDQSVSPFG